MGSPRGAAKRQAFRAIRKAEIDRLGHVERIERSRSKLIFFLTIQDSRALNGPVAIPIQLVNRMPSFASGSTRLAAAESRNMRDSGAVSRLQGPFRSLKGNQASQNERVEPDPGMRNSRPTLNDGDATAETKQPQAVTFLKRKVT